MSVAAHLRRTFGSATRQKGESYFRRGQVRIVANEADRLTAKVAGSEPRPYTVELLGDGFTDNIHTECSCPHYDDGAFCKHIWATVLAGEQAQSKLLANAGSYLQLLHRDDVDELDFDFNEYSVRTAPARGGAESPRRGAGQRYWRNELASFAMGRDALSSPARPSSAKSCGPARVYFIVDVAASAAAGALVVNLFQQELLKAGSWGKLKRLSVRRADLERFEPQDRRALELALGNESRSPYGYGFAYGAGFGLSEEVSQCRIAAAMHELVLPVLCGAGRTAWLLGDAQPPDEARAVTWDEGLPWSFALIVDEARRPAGWTVRGQFMRGAEVRPVSDAILALAGGVILFPDRIARLSFPEDARWLELVRKHGQIGIPATDRDALLAELWRSGESSAAMWPASLMPAIERLAPRGRLQIHAAPDRSKLPIYHKDDTLYASVKFDYGEQAADLHLDSAVVVPPGGEQIIIRDRAAEQRLVVRLEQLHCREKKPLYYYDAPGDVQFPKARLHEIISRLVDEGWRVEAEDRAIKAPGKMRATVASGVDWFDLETAVDFGGVTASLPQLLAAMRRNERFVSLDDGSQGLLPAEWIARFAPLAEMATVEGNALRFRPSQALLLDSLLADREADVQLAVDRQFSRLRDKLRTFAGVAAREAPAGFRGELRPYQKQGLGWLAFLAEFGLGGCLADDMGLGKTVQVLAWLVARRRSRRRNEERRPSLVVCPKSVVFNWQLEAERFAPQLTVVNHTGLGRRANEDGVAAADLVLTTYGTLRKDIETLKDVAYDYVILDEAQAIKNDQSVSAKACRLLKARHRLALTGTPVENRLGDLWSLFEFLNPGMLGRGKALQAFSRAGSASVGLASQAVEGDDEKQAEQAEAIGALRRGLAPFILRRTKGQVLSDLPEKSEQTIHVDLLPADRKRYNELRDHYRNTLLKRVSDAGINASRMHVLEALLRLRQTACHAGLVDKKLASKPSAKIELLLDQIDDVVAEGHKALVFSQFTSLLDIVRRELDARSVVYEYLDGRTRNRQARVERFQSDPACPLFLISLKAGGTGLNLTAADYVFLLDPWWNPAVEAQAIDRAHRIGQQRRVLAYRLVARDTVEEKILDLQRRKRELADAIIAADGGALSGLSVDDLRALLS